MKRTTLLEIISLARQEEEKMKQKDREEEMKEKKSKEEAKLPPLHLNIPLSPCWDSNTAEEEGLSEETFNQEEDAC
jgi:hypothetical protein